MTAQRDEAIKLALGRFDHNLRIVESGDERLGARGGSLRNVAGDDGMIGRHGRAFEPSDNDFLERVPLIMRIDGTKFVPRPGFRIDQLSFHVCPQHAMPTASPFHRVADTNGSLQLI